MAAALVVAAVVVIGYASGLIRTLGHISASGSGDGISVTKAESSWGFSVLPLKTGAQIALDYDLQLDGCELWVSFHNDSSLPLAVATGPQHEFQALRKSGKGRITFRTDHWGLYELDVSPLCSHGSGHTFEDALAWHLP